MDKDKMIKLLESAVAMLEPICVSHHAVDMMAAAKSNIRTVTSELKKEESKDG